MLGHHIVHGDRHALAFLTDAVYTSNRVDANIFDTNSFGEKDG
jgi:hypothetical protein